MPFNFIKIQFIVVLIFVSEIMAKPSEAVDSSERWYILRLCAEAYPDQYTFQLSGDILTHNTIETLLTGRCHSKFGELPTPKH